MSTHNDQRNPAMIPVLTTIIFLNTIAASWCTLGYLADTASRRYRSKHRKG